MPTLDPLLIYDEYQEVMSMPTRERVSQKTRMIAVEARVTALETAFRHWYAVGKSTADPCKQCGFPYADRLHKDHV